MKICYPIFMFHFEKKVLDNGLRVVLAPMDNTEAVTTLVLVGVGSRNETKDINGVSHFLEHMFFKGTKNRPKPGQIAKELDRIGALYNAFTSKEVTGFWVKTSSKDFDIGLDIISDALLEPLFKEREIEKERGVILQEISMYEDEPRRKIVSILENVLYGDQPIGWDILGTKETVKNIKRTDIFNYKKNNYLSKNIIVAAAGNISKRDTFKKIEKVFKKIKRGESRSCEKTKILQNSPQIKIVKKDSDQTHLTLAIRAYDMFDERRYALNLMAVILGGNMSSKLFTEIREKLGLAYYVYASGDQSVDCGYLGMGAGIPHEKMEMVVKKIAEIIGKIKKAGLSKKDLDYAKGFFRGQTALRFESSDEVAAFIAMQELFYKKIMQPEDILKKIEKISQDDILKRARDIFVPEKINMAVIGRQADDEKSQNLYKNLFSKI